MILVLVGIYSYDVVLAATPQTVIEKFLDFKASAVFSAEGFCWPDQSLAVSLRMNISMKDICLITSPVL